MLPGFQFLDFELCSVMSNDDIVGIDNQRYFRQKKSPRPTVPPPPVPTLASLSVSDVSKEHDNYESLGKIF